MVEVKPHLDDSLFPQKLQGDKEENIDTAIVMKEAKFDLHELFFSITKHDSTIIFGNETFLRISGYEKEEIIGKFHNIIRHEDMPRVVFKKLWEYIESNKPVVAYVKNKTKEGGYYWVLAVVFPLNSQYISIRIKPNTQFFSIVKEVYLELLAAEKELNMDESENLLVQLLKNLGFSDYDHFMNEVLLAELLERKKLLSSSEVKEDTYNNSETTFKSLYDDSKILLQEYGKWFARIESFKEIKSIFEEKGVILREQARDIVLLSLNASIASYKLDRGGETFGVLSSDIRKNAKENEELIEKVHLITQNLSESLSEIMFSVSYISLQMETVTHFIKELLENTDEEINSNVETLYKLVSEYHEKVMKLPSVIDKKIKNTISYLEELELQFMYFGYIQVYGVIESARLDDDRLGFFGIFSQLKSMITKTSDEIFIMKNVAENFYVENKNLINESKKDDLFLDKFGNNIEKIKKSDK
jgi:aerotaxis receptor